MPELPEAVHRVLGTPGLPCLLPSSVMGEPGALLGLGIHQRVPCSLPGCHPSLPVEEDAERQCWDLQRSCKCSL